MGGLAIIKQTRMRYYKQCHNLFSTYSIEDVRLSLGFPMSLVTVQFSKTECELTFQIRKADVNQCYKNNYTQQGMRRKNLKPITMVTISLLVLLGLKVSFQHWALKFSIAISGLEAVKPLHVGPQDVLKCMAYGHWKPRSLSLAEHSEITLFDYKVRKEKTIPTNLQRADKLCGNVTFPNVVYRALCDPNGDTPCCYNNVCTNKTQHQCTCTDCRDTRQPIHAEYATWRPSDPTCQVRHLSHNEICELLDGATLYFIGDSFVRHVFTAFLLAARNNETHGAMAKHTPEDLRSSCAGLYMFTEKVCRHYVDSDTNVCNNTAKVKLLYYYSSGFASSVHDAIIRLNNVNRSIVFLGIGIHDHFNEEKVQKQVLLPLLQKMNSSSMTYPKLVWMGIHSPGLLRSPNFPYQSYEAVLRYNKIIGEFLREWHVPIFEAFNLTDGTASFDGEHYGLGVNRVKVQILLNYLLELRRKQLW